MYVKLITSGYVVSRFIEKFMLWMVIEVVVLWVSCGVDVAVLKMCQCSGLGCLLLCL